MSQDQRFSRADMRERTERELSRYRRRQPGGKFWRSIALIGSVGWPIVLLALGGAWLGRFCDAHLHSGIRCTALLLCVGAGFGTYTAFRTLRKEQP